jgi:MFS family permease
VVVNVALPAIAADLRLSRAELPFTGIAYTLLFGSLLIVGGRAGDAFGRRRVLRVGLVLFLAGSLAAAAAAAPAQLFAALGVQGLGAALVSPNALGLLLATFEEGPARNRALGLWAAVGSGGAVLGQLVGGIITDLAGWPWIFLINVIGARPLLVGGAAVAAGGLLLLAGLPADGSYLTNVLPGLALVALGNGLSFAPILATATSGVPEADHGLASGLVNTAQEVGSAMGLAALASIAAASGGAVLVGYRWGYLSAAGLVATAALLATRLPRELGREPIPGRAEALTEEEIRSQPASRRRVEY